MCNGEAKRVTQGHRAAGAPVKIDSGPLLAEAHTWGQLDLGQLDMHSSGDCGETLANR